MPGGGKKCDMLLIEVRSLGIAGLVRSSLFCCEGGVVVALMCDSFTDVAARMRARARVAVGARLRVRFVYAGDLQVGFDAAFWLVWG